MALFKINNSTVKKLVARELDLERNLQELFEANLEEILNIVFLAHEHSTSEGGRIDTLGIDKGDGSPVIIEYKKNQNDQIINQGLFYLRWLLDHKDSFEKICIEKKVQIKINWDTPRVICIAEDYNKFDIGTVDVLPIKIELFRYRIYEDSILYLEPENYQKVRISTSGIFRKAKQGKEKIEKLQKTYSLNYHLAKTHRKNAKLFQALREKILSLDENIIEEAKAKYVAYKTSTNFTDIVLMQNSLKIFLNVKSGQLNDPQSMARDLTKPKPIGHWGNGDYEVKLNEEKDLESAFLLIKQSYNLNK